MQLPPNVLLLSSSYGGPWKERIMYELQISEVFQNGHHQVLGSTCNTSLLLLKILVSSDVLGQ